MDGAGLPLVELLVHAGLCPSKGQARKDIEGGGSGGIYINNVRAAHPQHTVTLADRLFARHILLRKGKKKLRGDHRALNDSQAGCVLMRNSEAAKAGR